MRIPVYIKKKVQNKNNRPTTTLISTAPGPGNSTWKCEICVARARGPEKKKEKKPQKYVDGVLIVKKPNQSSSSFLGA